MSMGARLVGVETAFPAKAVPSKHRLSILVFKCLSMEWLSVAFFLSFSVFFTCRISLCFSLRLLSLCSTSRFVCVLCS